MQDGTCFDDTDTWIDPIIGGNGRASLAGAVYVTAWGMVGGFGGHNTGVSSGSTGDVMGAIGCSFSDSFALAGGYRAILIDYENDDLVLDVVQRGLQVLLGRANSSALHNQSRSDG